MLFNKKSCQRTVAAAVTIALLVSQATPVLATVIKPVVDAVAQNTMRSEARAILSQWARGACLIC